MAEHSDTWKEVAWMLREREMPPEAKPDEPRPSEGDYSAGADWLDHAILTLNTGKDVTPAISSRLAMVNKYCVSCHNKEDNKGSLNLDAIRFEDATQHSEIWEKVVTRLQSRRMPPPNRKRPSDETYEMPKPPSIRDLVELKHSDDSTERNTRTRFETFSG
jgi:hypothetical protein